MLFWGVLGALVMRQAMIGLGGTHRSLGLDSPQLGALLLFAGSKMVFGQQEEIHPERNPVVRWFRKLVPVVSSDHGGRFVVRAAGRRIATPLLIVGGFKITANLRRRRVCGWRVARD